MAEEDETEAMKVPVSAGPCSLLAWPLGNLTSLITGKDGRPVFRWFFFVKSFYYLLPSLGVPNLPANTQFRFKYNSEIGNFTEIENYTKI